METVTQRRVSATSSKFEKPSAPVSAFDLGRQASKQQRSERVTHDVDIETIEIRKGVPLPDATRGQRGSKYKDLLARMGAGDSVELPTKAAHALVAAAKKLGIKTAIRSLGTGKSGVWKL